MVKRFNIFNNFNIPNKFKKSIILIGNFDGLHAGHQKLFELAKKYKIKYKSKVGVVTFNPIPKMFFNTKIKNYRVSNFNQKVVYLKKFGVDFVINQKFDKIFSKITYYKFIKDILSRKLRSKFIFVSSNFRFGHKRVGDVALLKKYENDFGYNLVNPTPLMKNKKIISSTIIRKLLEEGKLSKVNTFLKRNWEIEEFLKGEEMSYFIISDGKTFKKFNTAQDHKRVGEGDKGKNTGGMGAYSPSGLINNELDIKIIENVIKPTLKAIEDMGEKYKGFLYVGLMIRDNNPYLIEYNVRMGDPECQTILPLLNSDLLELILSCCERNLENQTINWKNKKSMCIVLCSDGYPDTYKKNVEIPNLEKITKNNSTFVYHAGTELIDNKVYATGGRVLNFVNISGDLMKSRDSIINEIENLGWTNGFYRKDIGFRIIDK